MQRVVEMDMTGQRFTVRAAWQEREWVHLSLTSSPETAQETVAWLTGVHPSLTGSHLMKRGDNGDVVKVMVTSLIFPSSRTPLKDAAVEFVGVIAKERALYDIRLLTEQEAEEFVEPSRLEWPEEEEAGERHEAKNDAADSSSCDPLSQNAVAHERTTHTRNSRTQMVSTASTQLPPMSWNAETERQATRSVGWRSVRQDAEEQSKGAPSDPLASGPSYEVHDDKIAYLLRYAEEDREMFKYEVVGKILKHPDFKQCLHLLLLKCGKEAISAAFDYPSSQPITEDTSSEWHWSIYEDRAEQQADTPEIDGIIPSISLRGYQAVAVDRIMERGNFLVRAATGAGKTRIFIEVARRTLMQNPSGRIVVVVPTKALTTQHKTSFEEHGFTEAGYNVGALCGDSSSAAKDMLKSFVVVVITAEKLRHHLHECDITFSSIQLLILDEVHHVRGNSPFQGILEKYSYLTDQRRAQTKIVGVTATPASGKSGTQLGRNFKNLLDALHVDEENIINIVDENPEIQDSIPQAQTEIFRVNLRPTDLDLRKFICEFVGSVLTEFLPDHFINLGLSNLNGVRPPAFLAMLNADNTLCQFHQWRVDVLNRLNASAIDACHKEDITQSVWAICLMDDAVQQSKDLGYESAISSLLGRLGEMHRDLRNIVTQCKATGYNSIFERLYTNLNQRPYVKMLPHSVLVRGEAATPEVGQYPKFAKLVQILQEYKYAHDFHGMVFVRTRSAVDQICRMLDISPLKSHMEFKGAVGRSRRTAQDSRFLAPLEQGMSRRQLDEVLTWFREEGKKVLITTNVSEEGINVISCELVVRYAVPVSGTEYTQSRGRARKKEARFVCIVEEETKDYECLQRCIKEAEDAQAMLTSCKRAQHI